MYAKNFIVICGAVVLVTSDKGYEEPRNARLFTFNNLEDDVLQTASSCADDKTMATGNKLINLEFTIPFVTIPTKKTLESAFESWPSTVPMININPASLAIGGAVVLGTTVLIPLLLKSYTNQYPEQRYSRLLDNAEFSTDAVLDFASQVMTNSQAVRGCALRVACWTAQRSTKTDTKKIWNHVMSNTLLSSMINSTAIEDAMLSGRMGRDCLSYTPCSLREHHIPMLINKLSLFANSVN